MQNIVIIHETVQDITISIQTNTNSTYNAKQTQYVTTQYSTKHNNATI